MSKYIEYKAQVVECTRWLSANGYLGCMRGTGGNVSVRIGGCDMIAITPSGCDYDRLQEDDICIVDFSQQQIEGALKPSIETAMHIGIYKNRPKVNAVVHTHQTFASIFAVVNESIPVLFDEVALSIGPRIDVVPYGLSGSPQLAENVANRVVNGLDCYVIQNHGALALGANIEKAWLNVELMEKAAKIYYYALSAGKEITPLPQETIDLAMALR